MNVWMDYVRKHPETTMRVSYEAMRLNPQPVMTNILRFVGLSVDENILAETIEDCRFERIQAREKAKQTDNPWLMPADASDVRTFKARGGRVGEYRDLFSDEQIERIETMLRDHLDGDFGYSE